MLTLNTPLIELHHHALPRVGPKTAQSLAREMAALTAKADVREAVVDDLLHYLPMRYEDRSNLARVAGLNDGDYASVEVAVRVGGIVPLKGGKLKMYEFVGTDGEAQVRAFWWNQVYFDKVFQRGTRVILYGQWRKNKYKGYFEVENPDHEVVDRDCKIARTQQINYDLGVATHIPCGRQPFQVSHPPTALFTILVLW